MKLSSGQLLKKPFIIKIIILSVVVFISLLYFSRYILTETGKKTRATGESVDVTFNPVSLTGAATATLSPLKIMAQPGSNLSVQGYEMLVAFDKTKLEVEAITYPSACPLVEGYSSTAVQANTAGTIRIACANISTAGFVLSASAASEIAQITFKSKLEASSNITIAANTIGFSMITASGALNTIGAKLNNTVTATAATGNSNLTTPTPTGGSTENISLNLKLKFQGITKKPNIDTMSVKVKLGGLFPTTDYQTATFTSDDKGVWSGTVSFDAVSGPPAYNVYVKGPKHLQKKICNSVPTESAAGAGTYRCTNGNITLVAGSNNLDFSGITLLVGDLPDQDGATNSYDISLVRNNLNKTDAETLRLADLNLDGKVDTQDYSLVIAALSVRSDEE